MPYLVVKTAANANKSYTLTNTCNKPRLAVRLSNGNTSYVALSQVNTTGVKVRGSNGVTYALVDKKNTYSYTIDRSTTVQSTTQTTSMKIEMDYYGWETFVTYRYSTYLSGKQRFYSYTRDSYSENYSINRIYAGTEASFTFNRFLYIYSNSTSNFLTDIISFVSSTDRTMRTHSGSVTGSNKKYYFLSASDNNCSTINLQSYPRIYYSDSTYTLSKRTLFNYQLNVVNKQQTNSQKTSSKMTGKTTYRSVSNTHHYSYIYSLSTTDSYYSLDATSRLNFTSSAIYTPGSNETIISSLSG